MKRLNQQDAYKVARALLLVGGLLSLVLGAIGLANVNVLRALAASSAPSSLDLFGPTMLVVVGIVALATANKVEDEPVDIVLAVLGILAGGVGGVLVAIAGISAIVSKHTLAAG